MAGLCAPAYMAAATGPGVMRLPAPLSLLAVLFYASVSQSPFLPSSLFPLPPQRRSEHPNSFIIHQGRPPTTPPPLARLPPAACRQGEPMDAPPVECDKPPAAGRHSAKFTDHFTGIYRQNTRPPEFHS